MGISIPEQSQEDENDDVLKKLPLKQVNVKDFINRDVNTILEELFSTNTKKLFKRFNISMKFLKEDPRTWEDLKDYRDGKHIVENIKIVNDCAERGIKLIQEYHQKITKDEEQR